jgi:hypothetical protein
MQINKKKLRNSNEDFLGLVRINSLLLLVIILIIVSIIII